MPGSGGAVVHLGKTPAEAADLTTVTDLVFCHMEPGPVGVDTWRSRQWFFEPCVTALGESGQCATTDLRHGVEVRLKLEARDTIFTQRPAG